MILRILNVVLLIAGLSFCPGCATDGLKMPFRDKFASLDFRKNDPKSAAESELSPEFRAAQKEFKKDPEGTLLAWALWQEDIGEYGEARKKYRELLVAYPDNIEAQLGLARIELSCGRVKQAEDILTEVAKQRPTNASVRVELGRLYTQQEDWQKAIAAFEDASAIDRENQVCRYELGVAFARSHRYDQALSHLTYAVGESAANYNIGYVLHEQGSDTEAAEWFQNALQTHPDSRTAEKTRAMLAQLSPQNSRQRNPTPSYPPANPSGPMVASQFRQATIDQFEPGSLEAPSVPAAYTNRSQAPDRVQPLVSGKANAQHLSQSSTLMSPVIQEPDVAGVPSQSTQQTANTDARSSFQTVSHAVPQEQTGQSDSSGNQPPRWHGANPQPPVTKAQVTAPTKWRGR